MPAVPTAAKGNDRFGQVGGSAGLLQRGSRGGGLPGSAPGEDLTGAAKAGKVSIVDYNTGLAVSVTQSTAGGTAETGDNFGRRVAAAAAAGGDLLAISAPNEDGSGTAGTNIGAVNQVLMTCTGTTPTVTAASQLTLVELRLDAEKGDRFGLALAFSYANGTANGPRLVVGAPPRRTARVVDAGIVYAFSTKSGEPVHRTGDADAAVARHDRGDGREGRPVRLGALEQRLLSST